MRNYETPELNTLKVAFQNNIGVMSDTGNDDGDNTPEHEFGD